MRAIIQKTQVKYSKKYNIRQLMHWVSVQLTVERHEKERFF